MSRSRFCAGLAVLFAVFAAFGVGAFAQSVRGILSGSVTDPSGAVVAGAKIEAKNEGTGVSSTTLSTSSGSYQFAELPLGTYNVNIAAAGFKTASYSNVVVQVNTTTPLNVKLELGQSSESVTVTASSTGLQTESSDVGGVVTDRQITQLPLALGGVGNLRSPEAFTFLLPGSTGPGAANSNNGIFISKLAGGQNFGNEVLLDGASQTRSENGSSFDEEAPSVEALQEFKVTTAIPSAEFGRTTGGVENFVTKSGANSFHGTAYDIVRNGAFDANSWFNNGRRALQCVGDADTPACRANFARGPDRQNDFGGTLGGPVWIPKIYNGHDRTFFFFSWEQFRQTVGGPVTTTVPTAAERTGDFSQFLQANNVLGINPCDGTPVVYGQIFDPSTARVVNGRPCRSAFPGNIIPPGRVGSVAKNLLKYYPAPQNSNVINNFTLNSPYPINNTTYTIRIDQSFGQKNKIYASYSTRENTSLKASRTLPDPVDPAQWAQDFITHFGRVGWDYDFTPNLLNHLNVGTNRSNSKNFTVAALGNTNYSSQLGIGNIDSTNFPIITVGESIVNLSNGHNGDNIDNGIRLNDSVFWQKGRHALKFGTDVRFQQYSPINLPNPTFNFGRSETAATNDPTVDPGSGNGFASLLLGTVDNAVTQQYAHQPRWTSWFWGFFGQDDFKASNNLTLNLGLRWDVDQPRSEAINFTSNFDPNATDPRFNIKGAEVYGSNCNGCNTKWADTYYKDFSPRIGFAYSPSIWNNKTVLRGGTAIFYGPLQYSDFGGSMVQGYSVSPNPVSTDGFTPAFNIDNGFPAYTKAPNLNPSIYDGAAVNGGYIKPSFGRTSAIYSWSLQLQQQVTSNTVLAVGYLGNRGTHLHSGFLTNDNNMPKSAFALGNHLTDQVDGNTVGVTQPFNGFDALWGGGAQVQRAIRPFPQFTYIAGDCCLENLGHSSYDAMLVSLQRNFTNGLQFLASYTWSKTQTDADSALPFTNNGSNAAIAQGEDPTNLRLNKSVSLQDIPNTFVISYLYELPFGKGKYFLNHGGLLNELIGGWQVGGIQRYESGAPVSFGCSTGIPGWDNCVRFSYTGKSVMSPAARGHKVNPLANGSLFNPNSSSYFNGAASGAQYDNNPNFNLSGGDLTNAAFFDQNLPQYRGEGTYGFGTVPRVTSNARLDPYFNEDFSLLKTFPIHEALGFTLKAEALNAFNRHTFTAVDTNVNSQTFGVAGGLINGPRSLQLTGRLTF
jgi:Carboxypeptidase regulatory-like domain